MREGEGVFIEYLRFSRMTGEKDDLRFLCDLGEKVEKSRGAGVIELGEDLVEDHRGTVGGEEHRGKRGAEREISRVACSRTERGDRLCAEFA